MRAITEGLFVAEAALAPEVGFTGFDFDRVGAVLGSYRRGAHILFSLLSSFRLAGNALYESLLCTGCLYATSSSDGRN